MVQYSSVLGVKEPHQSIPNLVVKLYCSDDTIRNCKISIETIAGIEILFKEKDTKYLKFLSVYSMDDLIRKDHIENYLIAFL
ncbi:hypothetical protein RJ639_033760 [Escallonia herrerae]|uniref:Ycf2 N-terminal domain-containing protein n=1 Tax=Escallonia herrerae TaxID=1293975 RepID=A0AA88X7Q4_9ASTE|nr:hypothetical protein RJ639_033760 [Escallonia herrerae]